MGDLGVFEAMVNAGKLSAEAAASQGFELEKSVDRAIFRAKERFGAYLGNAQSKSDWDERWSEVSNQVIKVIAEVVTPTPKIIRRVGAALRPSLPEATKKVRPSSVKTAKTETPWVSAGERGAMSKDLGRALAADGIVVQAAVTKVSWNYDQGTKLWTSTDPMQKFACPSCGHEQDHLGCSKCACGRQWNSWPIREAGSAKTGFSTYKLMAREIKMRGDQFKMAAAGNVEIVVPAESFEIVKTADMSGGPQEPPPGMSQPSMSRHVWRQLSRRGRLSPNLPVLCPCGTAGCPGCAQGDADGDQDVAGGVTEGSPIDQIQDALQDAVVALRDVQMLSVNPQLSAMGSVKVQKISTLRTAMDRFWALHKQLNYVAGMLAKEANEAIKSSDPRITSEAEFIRGYEAAAKNLPLPPAEKTGRPYLEGYVAFHKRGEVTYSDDADIAGQFKPGSSDESNATRNDGTYLSGDGLDDASNNQSDAGPFWTLKVSQLLGSSPATWMQTMQLGKSRGDQGESSSMQPRSAARRAVPKDRR